MGGRWSDVEIAGKTADIFEPSQRCDTDAVLLFLHGYDLVTLRDDDVYSAELERRGLRAVCPHGQRSWWTDVVYPEFDAAVTPLRHLTEHVVPYIAEHWAVHPPAIALTGIGMGGQGALQLAYRFPRQFPVVAAIAPAVDFQRWHGLGRELDSMFTDPEAARQQTVTLWLNPLNWPKHQLLVSDPADVEWFEGVERLAMKLSSIGIPYEADLETSHGGHDWRYFHAIAPRVFDFLMERVELESRRVS